jgi:hypothetical protein
MKPDARFLHKDLIFWANVKSISQLVSYSKGEQIKAPSIEEIKAKLPSVGLTFGHIIDENSVLTAMGKNLLDYFQYRAHVINNDVKANLMRVEEVASIFVPLFLDYHQKLRFKCDSSRNKQRGDKAGPAFFTNIINIIIEMNAEAFGCNFNPQQLTTFTHDSMPFRTLSRRVDGAFTRVVNPIAIWEIKEYYYSEENFGSRIADSVYESQLDGMELDELHRNTSFNVKHYFMVDGHNTWWYKGKSYLCRIIDLLHMGYIDEVLFGREVQERLPQLVKEWVQEARSRGEQPASEKPPVVAVSLKKGPTKTRKETSAERCLRLNKEWVEQYFKDPAKAIAIAEEVDEPDEIRAATTETDE